MMVQGSEPSQQTKQGSHVDWNSFTNRAGMYIRVIHHFFKQSQNETAVLNVFQDLKSKISEKLDQI